MKDIKFEDNIVKRNRIPILIYTPDWIQLFTNYSSKNLKKAVEELETLLSREKGCESEQKELEKRKKVLMNKILYISKEINEDNNLEAIPKMEEAQNELLQINEKLPMLIEELEDLPFLINQQNTVVLKETIKRAYELIEEHKKDAEGCQAEINLIRQRLGELIKTKVDMNERVNRLYSFIHGMVGVDEMEKLDDSYLKNK
jgi:flagellar biosynthesis/type III secretory pathway chaperone